MRFSVGEGYAPVAVDHLRRLTGFSLVSSADLVEATWDTGAYDWIYPEDALAHDGDMHGPAFALAVAGFFTEQFGHHLLDVTALGNQMPVATMGAGDIILIGQTCANAGGNRFFADV